MPIYTPDNRTYAIIGAAQEVHSILHRGLAEDIYCEALGVEFALRKIPFARQVPCQLRYKEQLLTGFYKIDFICYDAVIVEVKAVSGTTPADEAQVLNYLALTRKTVGLLLNFGARSLMQKRLVLNYNDAALQG